MPQGILLCVGLERLFENIQIDWDALALPKAASEIRRNASGSGSMPATDLRHVREEDLASVSTLETLYGQAVARGLLQHCEANFLGFLATAAYCRRVGENPAALFVYLVKRGEYHATLQDEDWAVTSLKGERASCRDTRRWVVRKSEP